MEMAASPSLSWLGVVGGSAGFAASLYLFFIRYYKWRDCFNELGRCYDPDGSMQVYTTGGSVWGFVSLLFLCVAAMSVVRLRRRVTHPRF